MGFFRKKNESKASHIYTTCLTFKVISSHAISTADSRLRPPSIFQYRFPESRKRNSPLFPRCCFLSCELDGLGKVGRSIVEEYWTFRGLQGYLDLRMTSMSSNGLISSFRSRRTRRSYSTSWTTCSASWRRRRSTRRGSSTRRRTLKSTQGGSERRTKSFR